MPPAATLSATVPPEDSRLQALARYELMDTAPEPAFDDLTRLASQICAVPMSFVSLVDADRVWFKSCHGVEFSPQPRTSFFCPHTVEGGDDVLVVPDAQADARFANSPLVVGPPRLRFYAGVPLRSPEGYALGALCIADQRPRVLHGRARERLLALSRQVTAQLELRRTYADLRREAAEREAAERALRVSERRFRAFMDNAPAGVYIKDAEGRFLYVNQPLADAFSLPAGEWIGKTDADVIGPDAAQLVAEHDLTVFNTGQPVVTQEIAATPDGRTRYWLSHKFLLRDGQGHKQLGGLSFDITDRKAAELDHERLIAELRDALTQVKTLSGFLPICASCKNIRDDAGYWQQIEAYLGKHSDLEFTHGICPECLEKLYPDFAKQQRPGSRGKPGGS